MRPLPLPALAPLLVLASAPVPLASGLDALRVVAGDLDNDADQDLVTIENGGNQGAVLLGDGAGSFAAPAGFGIGAGLRDLQLGRFNADAFLDLAVLRAGSGTVAVFLGQGDGSFGAPVAFNTGVDPESLDLGDANGDGILDLAVANISTGTTVLTGSGSGSFSAPLVLPGSLEPISVRFCDVNGDGFEDVLSLDDVFSLQGLVLHLSDGTGGFEAPREFALANGVQAPFAVPGRPIATADLDLDGRLDVLCAVQAEEFDGRVSVGLNSTFSPLD